MIKKITEGGVLITMEGEEASNEKGSRSSTAEALGGSTSRSLTESKKKGRLEGIQHGGNELVDEGWVGGGCVV